eukprot:5478912-Pyramimonas_sp.AAC.1
MPRCARRRGMAEMMTTEQVGCDPLGDCADGRATNATARTQAGHGKQYEEGTHCSSPAMR